MNAMLIGLDRAVETEVRHRGAADEVAEVMLVNRRGWTPSWAWAGPRLTWSGRGRDRLEGS
jgi:hypothetical protein